MPSILFKEWLPDQPELGLDGLTVANNVAASMAPEARPSLIVPPPIGPQQLRVSPYDVSDLPPGGKIRG